MSLNKDQKATIKLAVENIKSAKKEFEKRIDEAKDSMEEEMKTLENIKEDLTDEYNTMDDDGQESEKGQSLKDIIDKIDILIDAVNSLIDDLNGDVFDDAIGEGEDLLSSS
jgi:predicted  nucleic acid-binding Zn-ribbon protein